MQQNNQHQSSGFLNGFVIGLVVGVGIALLFTTKKGKRILKSLSEEGLEKVSNFDELIEKFERVTKKTVDGAEDDVEVEGEDYVPQRKVLLADSAEPAAMKLTLPSIQINTTGEKQGAAEAGSTIVGNELTEALKELDDDIEDDEPTPKVKPTRRRFFRGIPKRG